MIPFNKPYLSGKELFYISKAVISGHTSGNNYYTKKCQQFFEDRYGIKKCLLTTSCTDALEMAAILVGIKEGDEVIVPSYTFVSSAMPFIFRGAKVVFADSEDNTPNIDTDQLESLITPKTKVIVVVHYSGMACRMDKILELSDRYGLFVVEDAAQSIDSFFQDRPLGGIGHLGALSFHETKNIISGEGGMLLINHEEFVKRAEIIWEKGTNRVAFRRGEIQKYEWVDVGSSFLPSDIVAAFLYAQLENLDSIQSRRKEIWKRYYQQLKSLEDQGMIKLPNIPKYASNNGHMFFIICRSKSERDGLIEFLGSQEIKAVFHYLSLHKSPFYKSKHDGRTLKNADHYTDNLLRLPLYYELSESDQQKVIDQVIKFYSKK